MINTFTRYRMLKLKCEGDNHDQVSLMSSPDSQVVGLDADT